MYHVTIKDVFKPSFYTYLEELVEAYGGLNKATVERTKPDSNEIENVPDNELRKSDIAFINDSGIRNDLFNIVQKVNATHFGFDIWNLADIQYTVYRAEENGHYGWHSDDMVSIGPTRASARKISITVQLSDPSEYEGGDFEFYTLRDLPKELKEKGTVLLFPSSHMHRVTPVTKGVRKSLVAWFDGPNWR